MAPKILEVIMLVCFGVSWPVNLYKSFKNKSTKGKSFLFLLLIDLGYIAGMSAKIVNPSFFWSTDWWVFAIYALNFLMVTTDLILFLWYHHQEHKTNEIL